MLNSVILIGNLTRDPEVAYTPKGTAVAQFSLANNRKWTGTAGEKHEATTFHECKAWNKLAEIIGQHLSKGRRILVQGRLDTESWTDKTTQQKRSKTVIVVDSFEFCDSPKRGSQEGQQRRSAADNDHTEDDGLPQEPGEDDIPF